MNMLKLGLPAGSLQESTFALFKKAGFSIQIGQRSYYPDIDDEEIDCILMRAQEIPRYVETGVIDMGITGKDWVLENKADVLEICELTYAKRGFRSVRIVLAVSKESNIKTINDLNGKRIATEYVNIAKSYLKKHGVKADVEFSWGATEVKPPKLVDAIIELTETGNSLRANELTIIDTVLESTTRVIMNKKSSKNAFKKKKADNIAMLLKGALFAEGRVGLKMNIKRENLERVVKILPALRKPTVSNLINSDWVAIETVIEEKEARKMILKLKEAGAEGIIEYSLNKIIM
ncbi:ATP phosphoribosyltransferase [Spirochaetota bacterium]